MLPKNWPLVIYDKTKDQFETVRKIRQPQGGAGEPSDRQQENYNPAGRNADSVWMWYGQRFSIG
jgi:hypothetical protein